MSQNQTIPSPVFEGSEKRLELHFICCQKKSEQASDAVSPCGVLSSSPNKSLCFPPKEASANHAQAGLQGLRLLTRADIDSILQQAACCVVSSRRCQLFDEYVLSESSLFVSQTTFMLKTCGTTKLLEAVPLLMELASGLNHRCVYVKYSRASYLFPEQQPAPHQSFNQEVQVLRNRLPYLTQRSAYVLGDQFGGLQWHIFTAKDKGSPPINGMCVEVCMTELDQSLAQNYYQCEIQTATQLTRVSGIGHAVQASLGSVEVLDDFLFDPCGYSMNAVRGRQFSTIHVTPEKECSYASFEVCSQGAKPLDVKTIVGHAIKIFNPGQVTVAVSYHGRQPSCTQRRNLDQYLTGFQVHTNVTQAIGSKALVEMSQLFRLDREDMDGVSNAESADLSDDTPWEDGREELQINSSSEQSEESGEEEEN